MSNALIYATLALFGIALVAPGAFAEGRRGGPPPEVIEKWDADGDGKLSEAERDQMKEARQAKRQELLERYDKDGDGELSRAERSAARDTGDLRERRKHGRRGERGAQTPQ